MTPSFKGPGIKAGAQGRGAVRAAAAVLFSFAVVASYIALSLLEAWAFVPFWVQDIALMGGLFAMYLFARKALVPGAGGFAATPQAWTGLAVLAFIAGAALFAGFQQAGSAAKGRIVQGFMLSLRQPPASALFTLTAVPPGYLDASKQTLFSGRDGPVKRHAGADPFILPEGTLLKISLEGTEDFTPTVIYRGTSINSAAAGDGRYTANVPLLEGGTLEIRIGPYVSFSQAIEVIPDQEPEVAFAEAPSLTKRDSLKIRVSFEDDHGLKALSLEISRRDLAGFQTETIPIPVFARGPGASEGIVFVNLLAHRWAGSTVEAAVTATDALGQQGRTKTVSLRLPQKDFANPAAGVLISIRSALINNPERKNAQVRRLDALTQESSLFEGRLALYATLRAAYWKLRSAETQADFDQVTRLLWQMALALEDDGSDDQQTIIGLFEDLGAALVEAEAGDGPAFDLLSQRLEARLRYLFDRELGLFSTRTGMAEGVEASDVPALETFQGLIERMRSLHAEGRDAEALAILLQLQGYFEAIALNPDASFRS